MTVCELVLWVLAGYVADQTLLSHSSHPSSSDILLHRFIVLITGVLLDFLWDLEMLLSTVFIKKLSQVIILFHLSALFFLLVEHADLGGNSHGVYLSDWDGLSVFAQRGSTLELLLVNVISLEHEGFHLHELYCISSEFYPVITFKLLVACR